MSLPTKLIRRTSRLWVFLFLALSLVIAAVLSQKYILTRTAQAISPNIVISQVYGGGGNTGSTYRQDFIELFNRGGSPQSLNGWSVQYAAATGTSWQKTDLTNVTLQPGQYYLVRQAQGAGGTTDLPTADVTGTIAMSATAGKVALMSTTTLITSGTSCPSSSVVDLVGFGSTANCFEGSGPTPAPSNTNAVLRAANGCTDTDSNSGDFSAGAPNPRNTSSPVSPCEGAPSVSSTTPSDNATNIALNSNITVTFNEAVNAPTSAFSISCATSGAHTFALSGGPTTFTLDPDSDFTNGEVCTVTVDDVQVTDQDANDPPDNMTADYVFDFTTVAATPALSISDVTQAEGDAGTTTFTFNVTLTVAAGGGGVTFDIATQDNTATDANNDYEPNSLTAQTIESGSTGPYQFNVTVNGDAAVEANETFFVNVTNVVGATVSDGQGLGTITNDDVALTLISAVQGNGPTSPFVGSALTVRGIVTLLKSNGFFIQEEPADNDADPNTSEGIFVFTSSAPTVLLGDQATVYGTVAEFNDLTELTLPTVTVNSTGNTLPTAITLDSTILAPTASPSQPQLEKFEGMRMTGTLKTVAPNDNFFDVYTVLSSVARPMREPGIPVTDPIPPDPTSGLPDCCIPVWDENPERLKVDTNGRAGAANTAYTSNVTFTGIAGPLDYAFGEYRLVADANPSASANMTAIPVPTPLASEFTIASYNIENFTTNATQREKVSLTVRTILRYPDVIGVVEVDDLTHLQALRDEINNDAVAASDPNPMYEAYLVEGNVAGGGDQNQNVGFLVKTARLSSITVTQEREEETYAEPGGNPAAFLHDRPPLVLDAIVDALGPNPRRVLVVVNHLRSFIDVGLVAGDGPRVREKRKKQAESLADLLNDLQTANPGVPVISVGDYNAYEFNSGYDDSLSVIKGNPTPDDQIVVDQSPDLVDPNFTNLTDTQAAAERYSFIFEGTPQALDHHVINSAALSRNTRIAIARVNSDFPEDPSATYETNIGTPERNSDHDPVVSYYSLSEAQAAGSVIISEFRFRGPGSNPVLGPTLSDKITMPGIKIPTIVGPVNQAEDEFIEIYNNSDSDITVTTTDGSAGWAVVAADGVTRFIIPNNTVIPARGHFLAVNSIGYSLSNYGGVFAASGDAVLQSDGVTMAFGYTQDIPDGSGIALFRSANPLNFTLAERLDAAGYAGVGALYREGAGFPTGGAEMTSNLEYTFFRSMTRSTAGRPKDTGDNTADFFLADTAGTDFDPGSGTNQRLGAPGPENLSSPINRTSQFGYALLDPAVPAEASPNRERNVSPVTNGQFGTMTIRRTFTNNTGDTLSRLRFRIVEVTTFPSPVGSGWADLRALSSTDEEVTTTSGPLQVRGTTLEQPPFQSLGGGWNATLSVPVGSIEVSSPAAKVLRDTPTTGTILLGAPLNNGESIHVQFRLGVMQTGRFFFYLNVEASAGCPPGPIAPCEVTAPARN